MPGTSLIIPVCNAGHWIDGCMAEIHAQTQKPDEILFVDDASTDDTVERIGRWQAKSPIRIRVERLCENSGPGAARNLGMKMASQDLLCFMDVDDGLHPAWLEEMYKAVENQGADVAVCGLSWVYLDECGKGCIRPPRDVLPSANADAKAFLKERIILYAVFNKLFRKSWLESRRLQFPCCRMGEDMAFMTLCMLEAPRVAVVPKPLYLYRVNPQSVTKNVRARREIFIALNTLANHVRQVRPHEPGTGQAELSGKSASTSLFSRQLLLARLLCLHGAWYPARMLVRALRTKDITPWQALCEAGFYGTFCLAFLARAAWCIIWRPCGQKADRGTQEQENSR